MAQAAAEAREEAARQARRSADAATLSAQAAIAHAAATVGIAAQAQAAAGQRTREARMAVTDDSIMRAATYSSAQVASSSSSPAYVLALTDGPTGVIIDLGLACLWPIRPKPSKACIRAEVTRLRQRPCTSPTVR